MTERFIQIFHELFFIVLSSILVLVLSGVVNAAGWSAASPLSVSREEHSATLLPDGRVLIVGGRSDTGVLSSAELYDPATDFWSAASPLSVGREKHSATLLPDGRVLIAGGDSRIGINSSLTSAELYDPTTDSWSTASPMAIGRHTHSATLLPDGQNKSGTDPVFQVAYKVKEWFAYSYAPTTSYHHTRCSPASDPAWQ